MNGWNPEPLMSLGTFMIIIWLLSALAVGILELYERRKRDE